ncbi:hypothetical protein ACH4JS_26760 [Streptomyces sp. NPDC017638]|uniref:hypothetical protein n=1 Tax=Streptomyces sp. NPDC017638 TaxID=3365004 RepID=UPI00379DD578
MAGGEIKQPAGEEEVPQTNRSEPQTVAEVRLEVRDVLPGDRAVIGVEQDGEFVWLTSRKYVHPKAVDEFQELLGRIVREGWWVQNWPGAR